MPILSTTGAASARAYGAGGASLFKFTISSNQTNADLRTLALAAGWDGVSQPVATIGSGIYISSSSTGSPALTITGSFPNGVQLINSGYIIGMGGAGGAGASRFLSGSGSPGAAGGLALSVSTAVYINNLGTIGGGGGGGGGGGAIVANGDNEGWGGGGGGGGRSGITDSSGGAGGSYLNQFSRTSQPGTSGTSSAGGTGGIGAAAPNASYAGGYGGNGSGSWGSAGSAGQLGNNPDPIGYTLTAVGAGGAAGGAVTGNSNITWIAFGTRLGSVS